jgi:hypothetical protein
MTRPSLALALLAPLASAPLAGCSVRLGGLGGGAIGVSEPAPGSADGLGEGSSARAIPGYWTADAAAPGPAIPSDDGAAADVGAAPVSEAGPAPDGGGDEVGALPEDPLARGVLLHLPFEVGPSRPLLGDDSPLHQVATAHQFDPTASLVEGPLGQALRFPGGMAGGYLSVDGWGINKIGGALTIGCWYQAPADAPPAGTILSRRWATVNGFLYRLEIAGGKLELALNAGNVYHGRVTSRDDVPVGRWVHLLATFDGLTAILYVDGQVSGRAGYRMGIPDEQTPVLIGASAASGSVSGFLAGQLDEVFIYDRALQPTEVEALARGARPLLR